jgi:hypothetical protein
LVQSICWFYQHSSPSPSLIFQCSPIFWSRSNQINNLWYATRKNCLNFFWFLCCGFGLIFLGEYNENVNFCNLVKTVDYFEEHKKYKKRWKTRNQKESRLSWLVALSLATLSVLLNMFAGWFSTDEKHKS